MTEVIKDSRREVFLYLLSQKLPANTTVAELGVLKGDFSRMILDIICPKTLVLIDPFQQGGKSYGEGMNNLPTSYSDEQDYAEVLNRFSKEVVSGRVIVVPKYSFEAVREFENESLDVVYHDASHLYEDVKRDLNEWLPKLKANGIVAGHDYTDHPDFGVRQAVDEFCKEHNFEMVLLNEQGGDFALVRK